MLPRDTVRVLSLSLQRSACRRAAFRRRLNCFDPIVVRLDQLFELSVLEGGDDVEILNVVHTGNCLRGMTHSSKTVEHALSVEPMHAGRVATRLTRSERGQGC